METEEQRQIYILLKVIRALKLQIKQLEDENGKANKFVRG
jgi:hypothetical protein